MTWLLVTLTFYVLVYSVDVVESRDVQKDVILAFLLRQKTKVYQTQKWHGSTLLLSIASI